MTGYVYGIHHDSKQKMELRLRDKREQKPKRIEKHNIKLISLNTNKKQGAHTHNEDEKKTNKKIVIVRHKTI